MKVQTVKIVGDTRNTHATTMSIALRKITAAALPELQQIATDLKSGIQARILPPDARLLLKKVQREIAERHFQH